MCTLSVSNVIYHKFSHGAAFYMLNGKNVNVMLEYVLKTHFSTYMRRVAYPFPIPNIKGFPYLSDHECRKTPTLQPLSV